jgi:hypothetical protein
MTAARTDATSAVDTQQLRDRYAALRPEPIRCHMRRPGRREHTCPAAGRLLSSIPVLCDEIDGLRAILGLAQRDHQDLVAAARATLAAAAEGEPDHLYYLRDELRVRGKLIAGRGERSW